MTGSLTGNELLFNRNLCVEECTRSGGGEREREGPSLVEALLRVTPRGANFIQIDYRSSLLRFGFRLSLSLSALFTDVLIQLELAGEAATSLS